MRILMGLLLLTTAAQAYAANDALDEVNAERSRHGLPPFMRDGALTQAAASCADYRARNGMHHHATNLPMGDFTFLPPGAHADAGGCDGSPIRSGWSSCCTYDSYVYAGAAAAYGANGLKYCELFVSNRPNGPLANFARNTVGAVTHPIQTMQGGYNPYYQQPTQHYQPMEDVYQMQDNQPVKSYRQSYHRRRLFGRR